MNVKVNVIGDKNHIRLTLHNWREQGIPFIIYVKRGDDTFVSSSRYLVQAWTKIEEDRGNDLTSWTGFIRDRDLELAKLSCLTEFTID